MKVSFIVPARDKERHVGATARSVLDQTYPCDIFISDAGSTDNTPAEIARVLREQTLVNHTITFLHPKLSEVKCGLRILNEHLMWCFKEIPNE